MNEFKEMDEAVSHLSTELSEDACYVVVEKWRNLKKRRPSWDTTWKHLKDLPPPSVQDILSGRSLKIYCKAVFDFLRNRT